MCFVDVEASLPSANSTPFQGTVSTYFHEESCHAKATSVGKRRRKRGVGTQRIGRKQKGRREAGLFIV
jgi:hypothetical protein